MNSTEKNRYKMTLGLNFEIEEIIDHCKQDKQLGIWEFMTQVNEQDKAFKKLKQENKELKKENKKLKIKDKHIVMIDNNAGFLSVLETLFNESNYVAEIFISLPNADYSAILKTLEKHEDFFKTEKVKWQIKSLDLGFEIRFDRTNKNLDKKVI